jgi:hypothetical protein
LPLALLVTLIIRSSHRWTVGGWIGQCWQHLRKGGRTEKDRGKNEKHHPQRSVRERSFDLEAAFRFTL